ncbi:MAG TPA: glycosyltransferase family A protein [Xanthobacteraceae bacterium]|nr:glycosyltransferase family A protein [Xanthobacteraceae bacterium]
MREKGPVPAVSIVVPCFNGGRFVDDLLACLRAQTFRDFELIIVDDGSTDDTSAKLATLGPDVQVIRQANAGPGAARNAGFRRARADLIFVMDCDDTIEPRFLEETVKAISTAGPEVGFAFSHERKIGHRQQINRCYFKLFDQLFINRVPCCMVVRRAVWQAVGGFDVAMRDGYEDWEFTIALGRAGFRAAVVPETLFNYRTRDDGLMMSRSTYMHGALWRRIRDKHRDAYRLPALLELWWKTRNEPGRLRLIEALGILAIANFAPNSWFTALTHVARSRRIAPNAQDTQTPVRQS